MSYRLPEKESSPMNENMNTRKSDQTMNTYWIKAQMDAWEQYWNTMVKAGQSSVPIQHSSSDKAPMYTDMIGETLLQCMKMWGNGFSCACIHDETESKSEAPSPAQFMQDLWGIWFPFQKKSTVPSNHFSSTLLGMGFPGFYQTAANMMIHVFKEEFQKNLNMPTLGLTRFYQERMNKTLDTYAAFQASLSEFFQLISIPMKNAFDALNEETGKTFRDVRVGDYDHQSLYRLWIEKLEQNFMSLLKSQKYTETLAKTLDALHEYREAKKNFTLDILKEWPIATTQDIDEISKDLYQLKKRVNTLERR
jgi:hypothetical protein